MPTPTPPMGGQNTIPATTFRPADVELCPEDAIPLEQRGTALACPECHLFRDIGAFSDGAP